METLKAQYTAFDEYGIQFYECKKRVDKTWLQWIATPDEVWEELYNAYYNEKSFEGIKAFPILDLEAFGNQKGKTHLRNKREVSEDSSDVSLRLSASSAPSSSTCTPAHVQSETYESGIFWAAEALTELSKHYPTWNEESASHFGKDISHV
ncbi:protein of unknown function [Taphrina deformans PYCC 5710]|uniref:Uncharacterized protein n=1 Tax=Taphrina deformans (strain PYCC 5710 / ATCC 11124 / CBS 356.35 / IMI 108563 / JCM 9778 / NBRC 8474) TaxID=1097556 RepID=R4XGK6_TAPDE|nr:protein of unknown function [Taphrina deformans PYCC 5710]|eukprot:CCG84921.1 protein of unknown function [Taphrina deformans PYCC 5710]